MKFKFSLQPVYEHRQAREDKLQREFSEANMQLEQSRRKKVDLEMDISLQVEFIRRQQKRGVNFAMRSLYEHWIDAQKDEVEKMLMIIEQQEADVEKRRLKLVEAVKDRTIMEKLQEKEYKEHLVEEARAERKLFDEIAVREFGEQLRREKAAR